MKVKDEVKKDKDPKKPEEKGKSKDSLFDLDGNEDGEEDKHKEAIATPVEDFKSGSDSQVANERSSKSNERKRSH